MQSSLSFSLVLPGRLTRYSVQRQHCNRTRCTQPSLPQVPLREQAGLAPTRSFVRKISERLKSNFFFLVPARLLTRPTILDPGPYQSGIACPGDASLLPYRFRPWILSPSGNITHCQPQNQAEHQQFSLFERPQHCAKSRDEHDAHDALLDPLGPIRPICIATGRLMCIGSALPALPCHVLGPALEGICIPCF